MDADSPPDLGVAGAGLDEPDHLGADRRGQRLPAGPLARFGGGNIVGRGASGFSSRRSSGSRMWCRSGCLQDIDTRFQGIDPPLQVLEQLQRFRGMCSLTGVLSDSSNVSSDARKPLSRRSRSTTRLTTSWCRSSKRRLSCRDAMAVSFPKMVRSPAAY